MLAAFLLLQEHGNASGLRFDQVPGFLVPGEPVELTITAHDDQGDRLPQFEDSFELTVLLADGSDVPITGSQFVFSAGQWSASVSLPSTSSVPVVLRAVTLGGITGDAPVGFLRQLKYEATDLVADPLRNLLYVAVRGGSSSENDGVLTINPVDGSVIRAIDIANSPDHLAITDDASCLYVATSEDGLITRIDLDTWQTVESFWLGETWAGSLYASDICTMAGDPDSIMVARKLSGSTGGDGVACYRNGEIQGVVSVYEGFPYAGQLERSNDPSLYFFFDNETTGYKLFQLRVDANGMAVTDSRQGLFHGVEGELVSAGDLLFRDGGSMVDGSDLAPLGSFRRSGVVCPDLPSRTVFFVSKSSPGSETYDTLAAHDMDTTSEIAREPIPVSLHGARRLLRWGGRGLAILSDEGVTIFSLGRLIPTGADTDLSVAVSTSSHAPTAGQSVEFTIEVTNNGSVPAEACRLALDLQGHDTIESVDGPVSTDLLPFGPHMELGLFSIEPGGIRSFVLSITTGDPGLLACRATISSSSPDPIFENNRFVKALFVGFGHGNASFNDLRIPANDLLYDHARGLIWIALRDGAGPALDRAIVALDVTTGELARQHLLIGEPGTLALSRNATYLYCGLNDYPWIQRIEPDTGSSLRVPLSDAQETAHLRAADIEVLAGDGRSIIVILENPTIRPSTLGMSVYHDEARLPDRIEGASQMKIIQPSASPDLFFGYNNDTTSFEFWHLHVDHVGVRIADVRQSLFSYDFGIIVKSSGDRVFGSDGTVIDGRTFRNLGSFMDSGPMVVDPGSGMVGFISFNLAVQGFDRIQMYDSKTFLPVVQAEFSTSFRDYPRSVIHWGEHGLAFLSGDSIVLLSDPWLLPSGSGTDLATSVAVQDQSVQIGDEINYTVTMSNQSGMVAPDALLLVTLSEGQVLESISPPADQQAGGGHYYFVGDIPPGGSFHVVVSASSVDAGCLSCSAQVICSAPDTDCRNNSSTGISVAGFDTSSGQFNTLQLAAIDMIEDPVQGLVWAALSPFSHPGLERCIVGIRPDLGLIERVIPLTNSPGTLAISKDGRFLYTGLLDMPGIERIDLHDGDSILRIPLVAGFYMSDIEVLEGDGRSILVASEGELAVFDDSVKRPVETGGEFKIADCNRIAPSADPSLFFGIQVPLGNSLTRALRTALVSADGVRAGESEKRNYFSGAVLCSDGNFAVTNSGHAASYSPLKVLDPFPINFGLNIQPCLDLTRDRVYFAGKEEPFADELSIRAFSARSRAPVARLAVPQEIQAIDRFIKFGSNGFALLAEGSIIFIRSDQLAPSGAAADLEIDLELSAEPAVAGSALNYTIWITNHGSADVTDAVIGVWMDGRQEITDVTMDGASIDFIVNDLRVSFHSGNLPAGSTTAFIVHVIPSEAGRFKTGAAVTSMAPDPVSANDHKLIEFDSSFFSGPDSVHTLRLVANGLVADPHRGLVWASVPDSDFPNQPGCVQGIDPTTGLIRRTVDVDGPPGVLTLSHNGRFLYVASRDDREIWRLNLEEADLVLRIPLDVGSLTSPVQVTDMVPIQGDGTTVAVAISSVGIAIYDGCRRRPEIPSGCRPIGIEPSGDPAVFYGANWGGWSTIRATPAGFEMVNKVRIPNGGCARAGEFGADGDIILTRRGEIFDGLSTEELHRVGGGAISWVDADAGMAYKVGGGGIDAFSLADFEETGRFTIPYNEFTTIDPIQVTRWGADGFAILRREPDFSTDIDIGGIQFVRWSLAPYPGRATGDFPDPLLQQARSDSDGDGIPDGLEYVFATPHGEWTPTPWRLLPPDAGSSSVKVRFNRRTGVGANPFLILVSSDLIHWTPADSYTETVTETSWIDGIPVESVEASFTAPSSKRGFVRFEWAD